MIPLPEDAAVLLPFRDALSNSGKPLRVGVVLDGGRLPRWVDAFITCLRQIPVIEVQLLTLNFRTLTESKRPPWLTDRIYSASRARFDPFEQADNGETCSVILESVDAIRAADCGVILWFAEYQDPAVELRSLAKHGVFTIRLGDRNRAIPFWDEVANSQPTSTAAIFWHDSTFAQGRAVGRAETSTSQGFFITVNAEQPLIATMRMLAELCLEIQRGGAQFEERVRGLPTQRLAEAAPHDYPSNFEAAQFAMKKLMRSAYLRWITHGKKGKWFVAMRSRSESITDPARMDLTGFQELPLPKGVAEMADPFLWEADGRQYLLFEEMAVGQSRGRLACVEVLRNGSCPEMKIILERPYHLSYPCVVPWNGDLFLLPETSDAKRVDLYRFTRFPWELELVSSPIEGVALVDTTPVFVEDRWYFFTNTLEPFMETLLFSATQLEGPWNLHPYKPESTSVRSCRSAGQIFWRDGRLFRPTQDCSVRYGYAITVNEVTKLTPHEFEERPVSHIPPSWMPGLLGTHTWNESSSFQVIDGIRYSP